MRVNSISRARRILVENAAWIDTVQRIVSTVPSALDEAERTSPGSPLEPTIKSIKLNDPSGVVAEFVLTMGVTVKLLFGEEGQFICVRGVSVKTGHGPFVISRKDLDPARRGMGPFVPIASWRPASPLVWALLVKCHLLSRADSPKLLTTKGLDSGTISALGLLRGR